MEEEILNNEEKNKVVATSTNEVKVEEKKKVLFLKHCEIVCDVDKLTVDLQSVFMAHSGTIKKWAYIIHDKDDTRAHYHIYLSFGNASQDTDKVAKWFNLDKNFVERVKGKAIDIYLYLIHGNASAQHKHQYSFDEVHANFEIKTEVENSKIIGNFEQFSYAQQLQYVMNLERSDRVKTFKELKTQWQLYCEWYSQKKDRNIDVIFITGSAGTGKTTFAKKIFDSKGFDYSVSSSNNDPFQDYLGQKGMLLDDIRDSTFTFNDLLKILDNHTSSSIKSRFNNKVFMGELIIVTSSVPLQCWYRDNTKFDVNDSVTQLYRRIGTYIEVNLKDIFEYHDINSRGEPCGDRMVYKNEIYYLQEKEKEKKKEKTTMLGFLEPIIEPKPLKFIGTDDDNDIFI